MVELSMFEVAMKRLLLALAVLLSFVASPCFAGTYEEADVAYEAGDYEKAKGILLPLAKSGHAKAMNLIGLMHSKGKGYSKSKKVACNWYEKSAKASYASGQSNLGGCYKFGVGRAKNLQKAIYWKELAAKQGHLNAQLSLINLYDIMGNMEKAAYWGQKAVNAGSALGRFTMWSLNLPHEGKQMSHMDLACVTVFIAWLDKPWDYCD